MNFQLMDIPDSTITHNLCWSWLGLVIGLVNRFPRTAKQRQFEAFAIDVHAPTLKLCAST